MKGIYRDILRIAVPSIITNITTPLLSLLDVVIVGHLGDQLFIAAIAVGGSMFNMIYWLFAFLRMGASGLTAQANGASDHEAVAQVLWRGVTVSLAASAILILLQGIVCRLGLSVMDVPSGTDLYAARYFYILIWGAPAVLLNYTFTGWFLGQSDARSPMWISTLINVSNILISLFLVYGLGLKIEGVAYGTLSAQWIGAVAGVLVIVFRYQPRRVSLRNVLQRAGLRSYATVNINILLRTLCLICVTVWFTRAGASQGSAILAVNLLLMQFFSMFSYFMDGFAFAGESIAGNCIGRRDAAALSDNVRALLRIGTVTALVFSGLYLFAGDFLLNFMTDDAGIRAAASDFVYWAAVIPMAGFMAFTWDGIFIGATRTRDMLFSMGGAMIVFFSAYFLLSPRLGNHGLWLAFALYLAVRGVILHLLWKRHSPL